MIYILMTADISIHTPHTRCDNKTQLSFYDSSKFQSTHLIRGVTDWMELYMVVRYYFNPHTSYEVWLAQACFQRVGCPGFQSTHLIRGVTWLSCWIAVWLSDFNPHTSYEVWRAWCADSGKLLCISIHTPHTRCDVPFPDVKWLIFDHFNPHTSYEVWLWHRLLTPRLTYYFNPHTSYEVWQSPPLKVFHLSYISIHTPHTRCD